MCLRVIFLHPYSLWRKESDPEPDPLVRGTDLRIRICTKMSWIPSNGGKRVYLSYLLFKKLFIGANVALIEVQELFPMKQKIVYFSGLSQLYTVKKG